MASKFNIDITARDHTGQALNKVNQNFQKLAKGTPLENLSSHFKAIGEKAEAFKGITRGISGFGDASRMASGGIGEAASETASLTGGMGLLGGALGLGAVGLGVAAVAAAKFEIGYSAAGAAVGRFADVLGISSTQLQQFQLAGQTVGVSADGMNQALQGVSNTFETIRAGGDREQSSILQAWGVHAHTLANGAWDSARGLQDMANVMEQMTPGERQHFAALMGIGSAMNFLILKEKERDELLAEELRNSRIRSPEQIKQEEKEQAAVEGLHQAWDGLLNAMTAHIIIPWLEPVLDGLEKLTELGWGVAGVRGKTGSGHITATLDDILHGRATIGPHGNVVLSDQGYKALGGAKGIAMGNAAAEAGSGGDGTGGAAAGGAGGGSSSAQPLDINLSPGSAAQKAFDYFRSQGWSVQAAAAIVANLQAESGFNPNIVGDEGKAYGYGQWHADRQADFQKEFGHSIQSATGQEQLEFVQYELTQGKYKAVGDRLKGVARGWTGGGLVSAGYERPKHVREESLLRGELAEHIVHVEVNLKGAPAGTVVATRTSNPRVTAAAKVEQSLPGPSV